MKALKIWKTIQMLAALYLLLLYTSCGTIVGNPDNPDDDDPTSASLPLIAFDIPTSVSGFGLVATTDTVLYRWANRTERIVDGINKVLERLNNDKVEGTGQFKGKGPGGLMSTTIVEMDAGGYHRQAVICYNDVPFQLMRWSNDGSLIYSLRDFSSAPVKSSNKREIITEVYYSKGSETTVDVVTQGNPWNVPSDVDDGDNLVEAITAVQSGADYTFKGVNNWYADEDSPLGEADSYLVGKFNQSATGEFVAYSKHRTSLCTETFNAGNPTTPGWCLGRDITSANRFDDEARAAAWQRLSEIAIQPRSKLKSLTMSTLQCP